jgi:hypothetical protein
MSDLQDNRRSPVETRARRRIRLAVESRGYQLASLEWEPPYVGGEMEGWCGGWLGTTDPKHLPNCWPGDEIMGLSVEQVLAWVDTFVKPPESCECTATHSPMIPLRDDPQTGLHVPSCRWHIRYRLPWWEVSDV